MLEHWKTLQEGWVNALDTLYELFLILDNLLCKGENLLWFASAAFSRSFIYESSMPKDMTCARMRKYIELRDKL